MMGRKIIAVTSGLALAGVAAAFLLFQPGHAAGMFEPDDAQVVAQGAEIYATQCAACHGSNLEGQPNWRMRGDDGLLPAPPHDATGHTWHHDDNALFTLTKYGLGGLMDNPPPSGMPIYDGVLTDEEIIAVLSFIKSRWPDDIREFHDKLNSQSGNE